MEEIEHVVTENHQFDDRDELTIMAFLEVSDYQDFDGMIFEKYGSTGNFFTS